MRKIYLTVLILSFIIYSQLTYADDGYRLWLKYDLITNSQKLNEYKKLIKGYLIESESPTMNAIKDELKAGLNGLLGINIPRANSIEDGTIIAGTFKNSPYLSKINLEDKLKNLGKEGFLIINSIINGKKVIIITANEDVGALYGTFNFFKVAANKPGYKEFKY